MQSVSYYCEYSGNGAGLFSLTLNPLYHFTSVCTPGRRPFLFYIIYVVAFTSTYLVLLFTM